MNPSPITIREHAASSRLRDGLERCLHLLRPEDLTVVRGTQLRFATQSRLLDGLGSMLYGARWNPIGVPAVYASLDIQTVWAEWIASRQQANLQIQSPFLFVHVGVVLGKVLDVTQSAVQQALAVTMREMRTVNWEEHQEQRQEEAHTQAIGRLAWDLGLEALIVPSAANENGKNLVVFPDNVKKNPTSKLAIINVDWLQP